MKSIYINIVDSRDKHITYIHIYLRKHFWALWAALPLGGRPCCSSSFGYRSGTFRMHHPTGPEAPGRGTLHIFLNASASGEFDPRRVVVTR